MRGAATLGNLSLRLSKPAGLCSNSARAGKPELQKNLRCHRHENSRPCQSKSSTSTSTKNAKKRHPKNTHLVLVLSPPWRTVLVLVLEKLPLTTALCSFLRGFASSRETKQPAKPPNGNRQGVDSPRPPAPPLASIREKRCSSVAEVGSVGVRFRLKPVLRTAVTRQTVCG